MVGKPEAWDSLVADWATVYGQSMLEGYAEPAVAESVQKIAALMVGPKGVALDAAILQMLRKRPRSLTHGDARGTKKAMRPPQIGRAHV